MDEAVDPWALVDALTAARDSALAQAEVSRRTLSALQATTLAVAGSSSVDAVVDVVLGDGLRAAGADAGAVAFVDAEAGVARVVAARGYPELAGPRPAEWPLEAPTPWALTVASGEAWYGSGDDPRVSFEALTARRPASVAVLPLRSGPRVLGALVLSFDDVQRFDDDRLVALTALADLLSAALTRVRLLAEEERARVAVATAAERNAFLAEATALISAPLDERSVLERLARLCVPRLGDWCSILRPGGDGLERVIVYHRDPELAPVVDKMVGTSLALTGDNPVVVAYRTGRSRLVADVVGPMAADPTVDHSHLANLQRLGGGNGIVVPIGPPSHPVGALAFAVAAPRTLDESDVALATEIALRAGVAVGHAERFARERDAAASLQRAILPAALPAVGGVAIAAAYRPAASGRTVGGDWFDAFELADGKLALAIGDVAGHGIPAAATMAQLRHGLRAYLSEGHDPAEALGRLNRLIIGERPALHATALAAVLDITTGRLARASAGHMPPVIVDAEGGCRLAWGPVGPMLGSVPRARYPQDVVELAEGDLVLLFTDGLVERRRAPLDQTLTDLCRQVGEAVAPTGPGLQEWLADLVDSRLEDRDHRDDSCALALRIDGRALELELTPDLAAARGIRQFLADRYRHHTRLIELQLCATELITNAVLHGLPPLRVVVDERGTSLRCSVHDANPSPPRPRRPDVTAPHGRGLLLVDALADRWGVEPLGAGKVVWFELDR